MVMGTMILGAMRNAVLGVHITTPKVAVGRSINQPMIMPFMLNNLSHDSVGMYESPADHGRRTALPYLTCCFPNPFSVGLIVRVHL
jgi:hypothetical protein